MVTQTIAELLDAPTPPFPRYTAAVSMDTFRAGHNVTVTRAVHGKADFKLLQNVDELWAFAIRKPRDFQARLLGKFVQKDIFVATEIHLRSDLDNHANYHAMAVEAASKWDAITGGIKPLRSTSNSDYLGYSVRDMDEND